MLSTLTRLLNLERLAIEVAYEQHGWQLEGRSPDTGALPYCNGLQSALVTSSCQSFVSAVRLQTELTSPTCTGKLLEMQSPTPASMALPATAQTVPGWSSALPAGGWQQQGH